MFRRRCRDRSRPDEERGFIVTNSPSPFAESKFSITRDDGGRLSAVAGSSTDRALETVQALAGLASKAAALAAAPEGKAELDMLKDLEKTLLKKLGDLQQAAAAPPPQGGQAPPDAKSLAESVLAVSESLATVRTRIKALETPPSAKPGVTASAEWLPSTRVVTAGSLAGERFGIVDKELRILLVEVK